MAGEVLVKWERFVVHPVFKRYAKYAKEPRALFESIGEDLASSNEEIRGIAFWALVYAMPKLASILHERETRDPGWRDRKGKDQKMINRGSDIVSDLHRELVVEQRFKMGGDNGKDPRGYVNKAIRNRKFDEQRKHKREVLIDFDSTLTIPDPNGSVEDIVLRNRMLDDLEKEFLALGIYRSDKERMLFRTVFIDEGPFTEVLYNNDISSKRAKRALDQQVSRARKHAFTERDAIVTDSLIMSDFSTKGELQRFYRYPNRLWWMKADLVKASIHPGAWLNGVAADGKNEIAVQPLTRSLKDALGYVYLVAIHKDFLCRLYIQKPAKIDRFMRHCDLLASDSERCLNYTDKLIDPTGRKLQRGCYTYSMLYAYPTDILKLNNVIAEIRDDYSIWLIGNTPLPYYFGRKYECYNSYLGCELHTRLSRIMYQRNQSTSMY